MKWQTREETIIAVSVMPDPRVLPSSWRALSKVDAMLFALNKISVMPSRVWNVVSVIADPIWRKPRGNNDWWVRCPCASLNVPLSRSNYPRTSRKWCVSSLLSNHRDWPQGRIGRAAWAGAPGLQSRHFVYPLFTMSEPGPHRMQMKRESGLTFHFPTVSRCCSDGYTEPTKSPCSRAPWRVGDDHAIDRWG